MSKVSYQTIFGAIILILGILLLLSTTGISDTSQLLKYTPSLFISLGLYALWRSKFSSLSGHIILIVIFTTLQLLILDLISWDTIANWWPLLIIFMGFGILTDRRSRSSISRNDSGNIDLFAIFSGLNRASNSKNFRGGDITAVFGGVDLDLRDSNIEETPAKINIVSIFGCSLINRLMFLKVCNSITLLKSIFSELFHILVRESSYISHLFRLLLLILRALCKS